MLKCVEGGFSCESLLVNLVTLTEAALSFLSSGTHYLRGVNNSLQPWVTTEGRKQYGLKPANPTEEGLASLHSVLLRKQPYLWRAALLYYTVYHATSMSFSQLFSHIARFVQDPDVRWEYCLRAKRGQTDTSQPGEWTHTHTGAVWRLLNAIQYNRSNLWVQFMMTLEQPHVLCRRFANSKVRMFLKTSILYPLVLGFRQFQFSCIIPSGLQHVTCVVVEPQN